MSQRLITPQTLIPDMVSRYPATRAVLDRYGLAGCGGPLGPHETIAFFARLHGVPLEQLLDELNTAAAQGDACCPHFAAQKSLADTIYKPFFKAGIVTVLTAGCLWGAVNLLLMGLRHDFGGVPYNWTLAHGHAMVFGFVGLFVMGFAYQAFPRFKYAPLPHPTLAFATLPIMAGGIILQVISQVLASLPLFVWLGIMAGLIQLVAVTLFVLIIGKTLRLLPLAHSPIPPYAHTPKREPHEKFIRAALFWFWLAAALNPIVLWLFSTATTRESFLFRIATFNIPYRDLQFFGFAVMMILGVSLRFLPAALGFRKPSTSWSWVMFFGVNVALVFSIVSFLARRLTGNHWFMLTAWLAHLVLLIISVGTAFAFGLLRTVPETERHRSHKFVRAAYIWFIVAMAMLVFVPIYNMGIYPLTGSRVPFSHSFFGAYRHALTVGFITMMIVGVSSKVVPILAGVPAQKTSPLWATFLLLNFGNALRVSTEVATDWWRSAYPLMGLTGFLEVAGLALWGWDLWRTMNTVRQGVESRERGKDSGHRAAGAAICPMATVADIVESYPQTLDVFLRHGFTPLRNPLFRRTIAKAITVQQACEHHGLDLNQFLAELEEAMQQGDGGQP